LRSCQLFCTGLSLGVSHIQRTKRAKSKALAQRRRRLRKYAEGRLDEENSFYFRGLENKLHLRAYNSMTFLHLAEGVDPETWLHHLRAGEYSHWFRRRINNDDLAREAEAIETQFRDDPAQSLSAIRNAINKRYTLPAEPV
jgi:hypothetical protein